MVFKKSNVYVNFCLPCVVTVNKLPFLVMNCNYTLSDFKCMGATYWLSFKSPNVVKLSEFFYMYFIVFSYPHMSSGCEIQFLLSETANICGRKTIKIALLEICTKNCLRDREALKGTEHVTSTLANQKILTFEILVIFQTKFVNK